MSSNFCTLVQARPTHVMHVTSISHFGYLDHSSFPTLMTHPIAFDASRIDCESSENLTMSAAVVGPIVGKPKGMSSALEEYLENRINVNVALPQ